MGLIFILTSRRIWHLENCPKLSEFDKKDKMSKKVSSAKYWASFDIIFRELIPSVV